MSQFKVKHQRLQDTLTDFILESSYNSYFFGYFSQYIYFVENNKVERYKPKMNTNGMTVEYNSEFIDSLTDAELRFLLIYICFQFICNHETTSVIDINSFIKALSSSIVISNLIQHDYSQTRNNKDAIAINPDFILKFPTEMDDFSTYNTNIPHVKNTDDSIEEYVKENFKFKISYDDLINKLIELHKIDPDKLNTIMDKFKNINEDNIDEYSDLIEEHAEELSIVEDVNQSIQDFLIEHERFKKWVDTDRYFNNKSNSDDYNNILKTLALKDSNSFGEPISRDGISKEDQSNMVSDVISKLKNRGVVSNDLEKIINSLRETRIDYMSLIKSKTNLIISNTKRKTYIKPNRKGLEGIKGKKKTGYGINCILDTSGSMYDQFDLVLSTIFKNGLFINLIQIDTEVKSTLKIKSKYDLEKIVIKGLGGTELQPAINHIANDVELCKFNTVILTDGHTDTLDTSKLKQVLILSSGTECDLIYYDNVTHILINESEIF